MAMNHDRAHMFPTADGQVVAITVDDPASDYAVIDDGTVEEQGTDLDGAFAEARMRGGRMALRRATAEALMAGNDARCKALASSAQRCFDAMAD
ncbi:MAG: hypothetical protein OXF93_23475 [Acidobacteria bacterium]|nr:hypothetical protein [Acidobacteriota bacterium]